MTQATTSSTLAVPAVGSVPKHVAIIMDGNGRWATKRFMPRVAGHSEGLEAVRKVVEECVKQNVEYLTLFAFSSENWRRPPEEVGFLMKLFLKSLRKEVTRLAENNIRLKMIGDLSRFGSAITDMVEFSEEKTKDCNRLTLTIAANYGGRWDILQAMQKAFAQNPQLDPGSISEEWLTPHLSWLMRQNLIYLFAQVENSGLVIFFCGNWPTPSCISPTFFGQILMRRSCKKPFFGMPNGSVALVEPVRNW